jgi:hypothetical protein
MKSAVCKGVADHDAPEPPPAMKWPVGSSIPALIAISAAESATSSTMSVSF